MRLVDAVLLWCWMFVRQKLTRLSVWLALASQRVSPFDDASLAMPRALLRGLLALLLIKLCACVTSLVETMQRAGPR